MTENVGFLGLGAMGLGMAANLVVAGHTVLGFDPSPERQELARAKGVTVVDSPRSVAEVTERSLFSVVRTKEQTQDVLFGDDGVVAAGVPLNVAISSTLDPTTMAELATRLAAEGVTAVDTTMSGGPWGAEAGTLTLMVSGPQTAVTELDGLLRVIGENIFVVGDEVGTGQATKLAVQLAFGINMMGVFEALEAVRKHDVDESVLMRILSVSVGGSWVTENWDRVTPWWKNHSPGGDLEILLKDLRSVLREADQDVVSMPMSALTFQMLRHVWAGRADGLAP
ncbi:NAD(P)-dependent oxidoreductase [Phytoactinopolyspora alkaliphila]|uniref:NAD(P)-dependent oxidoreductase n=1 Tax=Phytoactinopolyspora alkaliphila TaxID=1783498 RepID=A0A6N9YJQ3_9ACTN|nr:NAD(P)-dependent oxidoreductase [Phytoactinopolyspora alkaliphila]NED95223.1 NAD(P)-dependent oxidoreductase [Phytoactinopolyspora alkaliphila]